MTAPLERTAIPLDKDTQRASGRKLLIILALAGVTALAGGATPALAAAGYFWPAVITGTVSAFSTAVGAVAVVVTICSGYRWDRK